MIRLSAQLLGSHRRLVAAHRAAFALSGPAAVRALNPVVQYDTSGVAIFPTPGCPLSLEQQSRC